MHPIIVAALYKFVKLPDYQEIQGPLLKECQKFNIKGSLLLAEEGINGTISGTREGIDSIMAYLHTDERFNGLEYKESFANDYPFFRMKVRLKKEIVTLGVPGTDPTNVVGTYLDPEEWNKVIQDPDVIVVDTRNDYEYAVGTFKNALNPNTKTFREFPDYIKKNLDPKKHKRIATFCTGGIRCEKATSYMLNQGFEEVYHLKGGILKYLEEMPTEKSLWEGECFVFDHRTTVKHGLELGQYDTCHGCRHPVSEEDRQSSEYKEGICCPHCYHSLSPQQIAAASERQKQIELAKTRGERHIGR